MGDSDHILCGDMVHILESSKNPQSGSSNTPFRECVEFVREKLHREFLALLAAGGGVDSSKNVPLLVYESLRCCWL